MDGIYIVLAREIERNLRSLARGDDDPERRDQLYQLIRDYRRIYPTLNDDPYEVEIKAIFADYPKTGKHLREDVYHYYMDRAKNPLHTRAFWTLFRKVFRIYECTARVGNSTYRALMFTGEVNPNQEDVK